ALGLGLAAVNAARGARPFLRATNHRTLAACHAALSLALTPMRRGLSWTILISPLSKMRRPVLLEMLLTAHHCRKVSTWSGCATASRFLSRVVCLRAR